MSFSGLSTNRMFTPNLIGEDVSEIIRTLAPYEAPFLDWIGDPDSFAAQSPKHEFIEDFLRPRYIIASSAIASATAVTGFQVNGVGEAMTVGTILENESAAPELMQVISVVGPNSIVCSRNWDGVAGGSLAAGGSLFVRWPTAEEGHDHAGLHTARLGNRRANTLGYFNVEIAATGTEMAATTLGGDSYENARAKIFREIPGLLESEILRGKLNSINSLGVANSITYGGRTMQGIRTQLTSVASAVTASSFAANPHKYIGDTWQEAYKNSAGGNETWGIVAGYTFFRNISDMNDTKVQDSNDKEKFKRVIRSYEGPFGTATIFLSRALPATELLIVPRERLRVLPLQGRNFQYIEMGRTGDNTKGMIVGEYTLELYHQAAMARLYV